MMTWVFGKDKPGLGELALLLRETGTEDGASEILEK